MAQYISHLTSPTSNTYAHWRMVVATRSAMELTNLTKVLEILEIESTNGSDFSIIYDPQEFKDRLRKCTILWEFWLAACWRNNLDTDLASYFPPSVEKLSLRYTRLLPFLHHFDDLDQALIGPHVASSADCESCQRPRR